MTARIDDLNSPRKSSPADVWATNDGIYLGRTVAGGTDPERPLEGQEWNPSKGREYDVRSSWISNGTDYLYVGEGHVATVAPPGRGKTRKLLMPNLFGLLDWSCVVIDVKGELAAHTAVFRAASKNHKVIVIDPFKVIERNYPNLYAKFPHIFKSHGFNPVRAFRADDDFFVDDVKYLVESLITTEGSKDIHFPQGAQALAKGLTMALRVDRPGQSDSLGKLRDILGLTPKQLAETTKYLVGEYAGKWPAIGTSLNEFTTHSAEDREVAGIRRTAQIQTDWLDSPLVRKDLEGGGDFSFASLKKQPTTVYLILPPDRLRTHRVWLRLMVTAALMPLLNTVERSPVPVLFMLDEFAQLGHMAIIEDTIAAMRGYGVKLWTMWQSVKQAQRIYTDGWEDFFAFSDAKVIFEAADHTTRDYFSQLSGERLYKHDTPGSSHQISWGKGGINISSGSSNGQQQISERVVKPYEVAALDADEALIYGRRGRVYKTICPQPDSNELRADREAMKLARRWIEEPPPPRKDALSERKPLPAV